MIRTRDVTVTTLLAFATQTATSAARALKDVTREAHTEEALIPKVLSYRLYMDLIQKITELITRVTEREPIIKADDEVNEINNVIEFMDGKKVFPRCKPLENEPSVEQFITMNSDESIMAAGHQVLKDNVPDDQIMADWRKHTDDKDEIFDQMNIRNTLRIN